MRWETVAAASSLLTLAQAAPRLFDQSVENVQDEGAAAAPRAARHNAAAAAVADGLYARHHKWGNAKVAHDDWQDDAQMTTMPTMPTMPEGCPTGTVVVSTTTVDVTVYVTPTGAGAGATEPCEDELTSSVISSASTPTSSSTEEPCPDETMTTMTTGGWNSTVPAHSTAAPPTTEPCPEESATRTGPRTTLIVHMTKNTTATSEPCPEDDPTATAATSTLVMTTSIPVVTTTTANTSIIITGTNTNTTTTTEPCEETTTWTSTHATTARTLKVTPFSTATAPPTAPPAAPPTAGQTTTATTTTCIIDTSMTPVTKSSMTSTPTALHPPTKTICEHDNQTGTPDQDASYCGVKGQPAGVYFLAQFIEERPGAPVTEEGCYQFCHSVMEDTRGCESYRFYNNELGAPRCDLYGAPVSRAVRHLDNSQPGRWYDLSCGCPTSQEWHDEMPSGHRAAAQVAGGSNSDANANANVETNQKKADTAPAPAPAPQEKKQGGLLNLKLGPLNIGL